MCQRPEIVEIPGLLSGAVRGNRTRDLFITSTLDKPFFALTSRFGDALVALSAGIERFWLPLGCPVSCPPILFSTLPAPSFRASAPGPSMLATDITFAAVRGSSRAVLAALILRSRIGRRSCARVSSTPRPMRGF